MDTVITVILPVYNREMQLRRAIASVLRQTMPHFDCIIVDDASECNVEAIVASYGDVRLRCIRREVNGGPYAARFTGMEAMRGHHALLLDSDWELYPWALAQALHYLETNPAVDMVRGLHVRNEDSCLFVRVRNGPRVITPAEASREPPIPDRVVAVRRCVVDEWLEKRCDYFALEGHQFLTAQLTHNQLYVDEPWTLYYVDGGDRVTVARSVNRELDDFARFLAEHHTLISDERPSVLLDAMLKDAYFALWRRRRPEAAEARRALHARGKSPTRALLEVTMRKIAARLPWVRDQPTTWV